MPQERYTASKSEIWSLWIGEDRSLSEKLFDLNFDAAYVFVNSSLLHPYLGGGLNVAHYSAHGRSYDGITRTADYSHTTPALNFIAGAQFPIQHRFKPFVEMRYTHHSEIVASDEWIPVNRLLFSFGTLF